MIHQIVNRILHRSRRHQTVSFCALMILIHGNRTHQCFSKKPLIDAFQRNRSHQFTETEVINATFTLGASYSVPQTSIIFTHTQYPTLPNPFFSNPSHSDAHCAYCADRNTALIAMLHLYFIIINLTLFAPIVPVATPR